MIEAQHLSKSYGDVRALDDVSFAVERGSIVGFLGPNGAGKSTTMRILAGLLAPSEGRARVAGQDVADLRHDFRRALGYLPESAPAYPEMRVRAYLRFVARLHRLSEGPAAVDRVIERVGLATMADRKIGALSKGYRQRVGLAQALVHEPRVVILDEPTSGLDPNQVLEIRAVIQALGVDRAVLFSSHQLAEVEAIADRVVVLNHGRLVADAPLADLRAQLGRAVEVVVDAVDSDAVVACLAALPGVTGVEPVGPGGPLRLRVAADRDVRAAIAAAIVPRWPLLELRQGAGDLAQVFHQLTEGAPR